MSIRPLRQDVHAVILVASGDRWRELRSDYEGLRPGIALGREFLSRTFGRQRMVFVYTGDDAIEAAVSAQHAVDRWNPRVLACYESHAAFEHVAERNGLELQVAGDLGLEPAPVPEPQPVEPEADEVLLEDTDQPMLPFAAEEPVSSEDEDATHSVST